MSDAPLKYSKRLQHDVAATLSSFPTQILFLTYLAENEQVGDENIGPRSCRLHGLQGVGGSVEI